MNIAYDSRNTSLYLKRKREEKNKMNEFDIFK